MSETMDMALQTPAFLPDAAGESEMLQATFGHVRDILCVWLG